MVFCDGGLGRVSTVAWGYGLVATWLMPLRLLLLNVVGECAQGLYYGLAIGVKPGAFTYGFAFPPLLGGLFLYTCRHLPVGYQFNLSTSWAA